MTAKATSQEIAIEVRGMRFLRAVREVLASYQIVRGTAGKRGGIPFDVRGGTEPYSVMVQPDWSAPPTCTCPDAHRGAKRHNDGYCKHIVAILLTNEDLRGQLLELFL